MANNNKQIKVSISVILLVSAALAQDKFPLDDPKESVLYTINEGSPVAYCLVHIEKGKKFEAKEPEPEKIKESTINSADWFKDKKSTLKLIQSEQVDKNPKNSKNNAKIGKNVKPSDIKYPKYTDDIYKYDQFIKDDNSIFKPEYTTVTEGSGSTKISEGYGIITDCYMVNDDKKVKRQVRYMFCDSSQQYFVIHNYRFISDDDNGKQEKKWMNSRSGLKLSDFDQGGDRFYIGPLSFYADGFMDTEQEGKCTLRIKSSGVLGSVVGVLGLLVVLAMK